MNDELTIMRWEEKDVRVGQGSKVNLVDVAKCCGLTRKNSIGKEYVRWNENKSSNSVNGKLNLILSCDATPTHIKNEITTILFEIDSSDDRNSIYVSNWLAQRIATECKSQTAMEFKNWLVTLNCAREEIEKQSE